MWNKNFHERIFQVLILSVSFFLAIFLIQPNLLDVSELNRIESRRFWMKKIYPGRKFDALILGDSRTHIGLSPKIMMKELRNFRIFNFGLSGGGLNTEIYRIAETYLDPKSPRKAFILGITPRSLTVVTEKNVHYWMEKERPFEEYIQSVYIDPNLKLFLPVHPMSIARFLLNKRIDEEIQKEFYDDGWSPVQVKSADTNSLYCVEMYKKIFSISKVSRNLITDLICQTAEWNTQGIMVFGFIFPSCKEMENVERNMSGLREEELSARFRDAGGIWLEPVKSGLFTYDGSHLNKNSAILFSESLAKQIRDLL